MEEGNVHPASFNGLANCDLTPAYRRMSPALVDFEASTDNLSSCLADCHLFVDSVRSDAASVQALLPQVRASFAQMETLFASVDRLEELVATATTNVEMLEHEMTLAERELSGETNSGHALPSTSGSSLGKGQKGPINSAGTAIKRLFKPKSTSSSSSSQAKSGAGSSLYMAPPQIFFTSDYFPPKTAANSNTN